MVRPRVYLTLKHRMSRSPLSAPGAFCSTRCAPSATRPTRGLGRLIKEDIDFIRQCLPRFYGRHA